MIEFQLPDMTCGHCVGVVTQTLKRADPDCEVRFDLRAKTVQVRSAEGRETLAGALTEAGYRPA